jgi:hypothetical protein
MKYDIPDEFKPFISSVRRQCKTYGVELILSPSRTVVLTDDYSQDCHGYFDDTYKALVVACGRPFHDWIEILVHEFCHMEQWKSDERWDKWTDACDTTWTWMSRDRILNKTQLNRVMDSMVELEKDCEMRAVEKIRKWGLPIPISTYIKKANIYLYSYHMLPELKKFPTGVYGDKVLIGLSSDKFKKSYRKVPEPIRNRMLELAALPSIL